MKRLLLLLAFILPVAVQGQLALNTNWTPTQLVQNVLVGGGVIVTNVTYTGHADAIGEFLNGSTTNIGLNRGIIMSSGDVTLAIGPNTGGGTGQSNGYAGDPTLAALIPGYTVNDAAVIEFDFTPLADTIRFRYVFGSDEYPEYVNSNFNDVFGFFITGPQPGSTTPYTNFNIALIPGTQLPVTIDNVNNGTANTGPCMNCAYYVNNLNGQTIEYDGFTTVLTAWALVVPCQTYHFKIAIGDAGDYVFDSAVFLEENSFSTDAITLTTEYSVPGAGATAIEGCNDAILTLQLAKTYVDTFWVYVDSVWGTATNGVDYPQIPDSIGIPPGQTTGQIVIAPVIDYVAEGIEWVNLIIPTSVCQNDTIKIPMMDYIPIELDIANDTSVCQGQAGLWVNANHGLPPYIYDWDPPWGLNNPNIPNPLAVPLQTTTYVVSVSDSTGCPAVFDSVKVTVNNLPLVSFNYQPTEPGCEPFTVQFNDLSTPNIAGWNWDFGDGTTSNMQHPSHTYMAGLYDIELTVTTDSGCSNTLSVPDLILVHPLPSPYFDPDPPVTNLDNPTISFIDMSTGATQWEWDFGDPGSPNNSSTQQNPNHTYSGEGEFIVWLVTTSPYGCVDSISRTVLVVVDRVTIPNIITPNGDGANDYLQIENAEHLDWSQLIITNRWGRKVAEMTNYDNSTVRWDAEGLSDGVYYYIFRYKTYFDDKEKSGTITVMRE